MKNGILNKRNLFAFAAFLTLTLIAACGKDGGGGGGTSGSSGFAITSVTRGYAGQQQYGQQYPQQQYGYGQQGYQQNYGSGGAVVTVAEAGASVQMNAQGDQRQLPTGMVSVQSAQCQGSGANGRCGANGTDIVIFATRTAANGQQYQQYGQQYGQYGQQIS